MEEISNKLSPIFSKILGSQVLDRVLGKDGTDGSDVVGQQSTITSGASSNSSCTLEQIKSGPLAGQCWDMTVRHSSSRYSHSRQLGKLDPRLYLSEEGEDLYDITPGHLGRIWFTVSYSRSNELLKVTVHKARNLRKWSVFGSLTPDQSQIATQNEECLLQDFRVKLFLEQAERKYHMTATKKQTDNPDFNEQFCFQVAAHDLGQQTLRIHVLGLDKRRRCKLIGYATYGLSALENNTSDDQEIRTFRDLQLDDESGISANPQLLVALTYFPTTERLIVGLFECRNLPLKENGLPIDVYAKVVLYQGLQGKELKSKRTESLGTRDSFDESFVFQKIPDPTNINLRITLVQHGFIDKQICFIVLGGELVSKGRGVLHWSAMLEHPDKQVSEWHELQLF
ncbi:Synaptotagmin-15 [Clonorchis sinensis]|uniref:Synaptotagmin-15 n=2 Tax=Clonorchis sinensis TaxID=79923 RepID=A0A8T1M7S5_CLOSI|nr:Synaptotagmin-15 [Clonorchis sinensis]GAA55518.1 synaptotagmin-15 [Clonorchis sinensis]